VHDLVHDSLRVLNENVVGKSGDFWPLNNHTSEVVQDRTKIANHH